MKIEVEFKDDILVHDGFILKDNLVTIKTGGAHRSTIWVVANKVDIVEQTDDTIVLDTHVVRFKKSGGGFPLYSKESRRNIIKLHIRDGKPDLIWDYIPLEMPEWLIELKAYTNLVMTPHNEEIWDIIGQMGKPRYEGEYVWVTSNNKLYVTTDKTKWVKKDPEKVSVWEQAYKAAAGEFAAKINVFSGVLVLR